MGARFLLDGKKGEALASEVRQRIVRVVGEDPGVPVGEIMRRLSLGSGTLYHHLAILARVGAVRSIVVGRRRLIYPAAVPAPTVQAGRDASALRGRTAMRIATAIAKQPCCTVSDIIEVTGESARAAYYHVKKLREAGLVAPAMGHPRGTIMATPRLLEVFDRKHSGNEHVAIAVAEAPTSPAGEHATLRAVLPSA